MIGHIENEAKDNASVEAMQYYKRETNRRRVGSKGITFHKRGNDT